ncbi:MAG: endonuclease/exonuclease/phosphatase family protein [FCB group bacterium]|jgi:endonuclease/exonuclease/phosphatase family metal-dependent hydrolase|nr:endonuclease/exonuclease/phosphatase family protein [FCB group bacterium]
MIWLMLALTAVSEPSFRVVTYNIHHAEGTDGKLDLDRIATVIRELRPDVVCLQEVDRGLSRTNRTDMPQRLADLLDMEVIYGSNYEFDGGQYGNATLSRLPIVSQENAPLPTPPGDEPRGCLRTTIRVGTREVDVYNAHFGLTPEQRKEQASALMTRLGANPTVVAGDLNEGPEGATLGILTAKLRDTAERNSPKRIDYVLVSAELDVLSSRLVTSPPADRASDHLPFAADLRLTAPPKGAEAQGIYDADDERVDTAVGEK